MFKSAGFLFVLIINVPFSFRPEVKSTVSSSEESRTTTISGLYIWLLMFLF